LRVGRNSFIATEGIPFLLVAAIGCWLTWRHAGWAWVPVPAAVFAALYLVFRDPNRRVPPAALGVVSPVDGEVVAVDRAEGDVLQGRVQRIVIRIDGLGTYTARSPVEGRVLDPNAADGASGDPKNVLWLRTDEGDDVVLGFSGYRLLPPRSLARYGERLGQGERCAYLRLARMAKVELSESSRVLVEPGQVLRAGSDLIAHLPQP
jgi:phosphatidylserine decarboxylase